MSLGNFPNCTERTKHVPHQPHQNAPDPRSTKRFRPIHNTTPFYKTSLHGSPFSLPRGERERKRSLSDGLQGRCQCGDFSAERGSEEPPTKLHKRTEEYNIDGLERRDGTISFLLGRKTDGSIPAHAEGDSLTSAGVSNTLVSITLRSEFEQLLPDSIS